MAAEMTRTPFNDNWTVGPLVSPFARLGGETGRAVRLPHDAIRTLDRSEAAHDGGRTGYHPGGAFEYSKTFDVPDAWRTARVALEFDGVYRDAMVFVNGVFAGQRASGYARFRVALDPYLRYGQHNTIRVEARAHDDSRWYSGAGIYREVTLEVTPLTHFIAGALAVKTPDIDAERAVVVIQTEVKNEDIVTRTVRVTVALRDPSGLEVARKSSPVTVVAGGTASVRIPYYVSNPRLWSTNDPALYSAEAELSDEIESLQQEHLSFGVRSIRLDPVHGLRLNGATVKLRGACIHHDNGPLGAAAIGAADRRRIELLKAAGFNAIRSSHNPLSETILDACDRVGMLVMEEAFDMWTQAKNAHDYSLDFTTWWERDIESMVERARNHPSVIMYSIGNEIAETGDPLASEWGRRLANKLRELDDTRLVTNAINPFLSVLGDIAQMIVGNTHGDEGAVEGGVNAVMDTSVVIEQVMKAPFVSDRIEASASVLDVVGLNYSELRYELDHSAFPDRIMVGSETFPAKIADNWRLVEKYPHVIGDFTWTGWDYLGEVGIGRTKYADDSGALEASYPWVAAATGDIDIIGRRRPISYYREIVWGLRREPYIAVHPPRHAHRQRVAGMWSWDDSVSSWTWPDGDGITTDVDVYSDADEVELILNGRSLGRRLVGEERAFVTSFRVIYEAGSLEAVSYVDGTVTGRTVLTSADTRDRTLHAWAEADAIAADDHALAFVHIEIRDKNSVLDAAAEMPVRVDVRGAGELEALSGGRPDTHERFDADTCTTHLGEALAIIRPTGVGRIEITVTMPDSAPVVVLVDAAS